MPKFLIDENLSPKLAQYLRLYGYQAKSVREIGLRGALDQEIISWCKKNKYVVITRDLGFGYVYSQSEKKFGVILLRGKDESIEALQEILGSLHENGILKKKSIVHELVVASAKKVRTFSTVANNEEIKKRN